MRRIKPKKKPKPIDRQALEEVVRPLVREFVEAGILTVLNDQEVRACFSRLCFHKDQAQCVEAIAVAMCAAPATPEAS
jgi:hypothetical protein